MSESTLTTVIPAQDGIHRMQDRTRESTPTNVIPAQAGIHCMKDCERASNTPPPNAWTPASAGMTIAASH